MNNLKVLDKIYKLIPLALIFLMPLFFLPFTTEFFEINKLMLLIISVLFLVLLVAIKVLNGERISFTRSNLDAPLIFLLIVTTLGTIFSFNKFTSIFGAQARWYPSLMGVATIVLFYYLTSSINERAGYVKAALNLLIASSTISTVLSLLSYYGLFIGSAPYLKVVNFSTTGSTTSAALLAVIALLAASITMLYSKSFPTKITMLMVIIINLFFVGLTNTLVGWVALVTGLVASVMYVNLKKVEEYRNFYISAAIVVMVIVLSLVVPQTRKLLVNSNYPYEATLSLKESWVVAAATIQDYPLLATGPSTFAFNFTRYKPLSVNNTPFWDTRFDKPYNEFINTLATTGIVGLVALLFLTYTIIKTANHAKFAIDDSGITSTVAVLILAVFSTYFVSYATILSTFLLVSLLSLFVITLAHPDNKMKFVEVVAVGVTTLSSVPSLLETAAIKKEYVKYIMAIPVVAVLAYVGFINGRNYAGEVFFRRSLEAAAQNNGTMAYEYQRMAIEMNPRQEVFQLAYAQTNIALANVVSSKESLTENEKQTVQTLISQAIKSAQNATEVVNPLNAAGWEIRAALYRSISNVAQNANDWGIAAYNTAVQLDPANPRLRLELGGMYFAKKDYLSAATQFRQATALKPDYANAHYNFAQALINLNDLNNAQIELEATRSLVADGSEDASKVEAEIAAITQQINVAGAADQRPTVEQLTKDTEQKPTTPQEPLSTVGKE